MPPALTSKDWAQIRYDYEHTERPIHEICAEHGISTGTLRDRMRRWGWTRRRPPIPRDGPSPLPAPVPAWREPAAASAWQESSPHPAASPGELYAGGADLPAAPADAPPPPPPPGEGGSVPAAASGQSGADAGTGGEIDDSAIVPRLESAVARVLPAIEATVAKLAAGATQPRELERAARALASLTRTLRELHNLLQQRQPPAADPEPEDQHEPRDMDAFRWELVRRMNAIVEAREAREAAGDG